MAALIPCHDVLLDELVGPLHKQLVGQLRTGGAAALIQCTRCRGVGRRRRQFCVEEEGRKQRHVRGRRHKAGGATALVQRTGCKRSRQLGTGEGRRRRAKSQTHEKEESSSGLGALRHSYSVRAVIAVLQGGGGQAARTSSDT